MSEPDTAREQLRRFELLGLRTADLPSLRDVDTFPEALEVASLVPRSRFAQEVESTVAEFAAWSSRERAFMAMEGRGS
jgi:hypothetical protein